MYQLLTIIHCCFAVLLIGLVLIQHGKGADIGAGLGSGASNTVFGSQGTGGFLFKLTGGLALGFFVTSLLLSAIVSKQYNSAAQLTVPVINQPAQSESAIPAPAQQEMEQ